MYIYTYTANETNEFGILPKCDCMFVCECVCVLVCVGDASAVPMPVEVGNSGVARSFTLAIELNTEFTSGGVKGTYTQIDMEPRKHPCVEETPFREPLVGLYTNLQYKT